MDNYQIIDVHISQIRNGDTILHYDKIKTVNDCNIKRCDFMGITIFGDSYNLGYKSVKKIISNELRQANKNP